MESATSTPNPQKASMCCQYLFQAHKRQHNEENKPLRQQGFSFFGGGNPDLYNPLHLTHQGSLHLHHTSTHQGYSRHRHTATGLGGKPETGLRRKTRDEENGMKADGKLYNTVKLL